MRFGVVGFETDGLLILPHRFHQLTLVLECLAQVVMKERDRTAVSDRLADVLDRQVMLPHLAGDHPSRCRASALLGSTCRICR